MASLVAAVATVATAQDYPNKAIVIVVPAAAGGPTDTLTRVLASSMSNAMKNQFLIENAGGAGGIIGINKAAKARPDGYTLMLYHIGMSTAPALYRKLPYDTLADFDYIGQVADVPMMLIAKKATPSANFQEFLAYIKGNRDKVTYANAGIGSASYLCGLLFMTSIDAQFKARLAELGAEPVPLSKVTPDSLRTRLKSEIDKWTPIIRKSGVYAD